MLPRDGTPRGILGPEADQDRARRHTRDRLAADRRRRDHASLAELAMPLTTFYSSAYQHPLQRLPAGPARCPESCRYCHGTGAA